MSSRTVEPNLDELIPTTYLSELIPTSTDQNTTDVSQKQSLVSDDSSIISPISNNEEPVPCLDGEKYLDKNSYLDGVQDQIDDSKNVMQSTDTALSNLSIADQKTVSPQQEQQYSPCFANSNESGSDAAFTEQTAISSQQGRCSSVASNDIDPLASSGKQNSSSSKIPCKHGERCYRKNPEHLEKYSHPHQREFHTDNPTKPTRSSSLSKMACWYGERCNRKNPEHLVKYFHPSTVAEMEANIEAKREKAEEEMQRQKTEIEALRQKMEEELQLQATEAELRRQKMEEELQRRQAEMELGRQKMEEELQQRQAEMELGRRKTEEELQRQKAEIEVERQKAEEELQRQKAEMEVERQKMEENLKQQKAEMELGRQKAAEQLQRQTSEIELRGQKVNEALQHQITHMEAEREKAQMHLELVEKQFRESLAGVENEKKYLEESIEKLSQERMKIATYHQQLENALAQELNDRERRELEKQRILEIKRDVPSYWGINAFDEPYREIQISPKSPEFNIIRDLLNDTIEAHGDKFGTIYKKDPTEFLVTNITRIHNKKLWHEYCFKKVNTT
jgi:hypothetical protein